MPSSVEPSDLVRFAVPHRSGICAMKKHEMSQAVLGCLLCAHQTLQLRGRRLPGGGAGPQPGARGVRCDSRSSVGTGGTCCWRVGVTSSWTLRDRHFLWSLTRLCGCSVDTARGQPSWQ